MYCHFDQHNNKPIADCFEKKQSFNSVQANEYPGSCIPFQLAALSCIFVNILLLLITVRMLKQT